MQAVWSRLHGLGTLIPSILGQNEYNTVPDPDEERSVGERVTEAMNAQKLRREKELTDEFGLGGLAYELGAETGTGLGIDIGIMRGLGAGSVAKGAASVATGGEGVAAVSKVQQLLKSGAGWKAAYQTMAKELAPEAAKWMAYTAATTDGDVESRAKAAVKTGLFMMTPLAGARAPSDLTAIAAATAANLGISVASGDVQNAVEGSQSLGEAMVRLIPVVGPAAVFGMMSKSLKAQDQTYVDNSAIKKMLNKMYDTSESRKIFKSIELETDPVKRRELIAQQLQLKLDKDLSSKELLHEDQKIVEDLNSGLRDPKLTDEQRAQRVNQSLSTGNRRVIVNVAKSIGVEVWKTVEKTDEDGNVIKKRVGRELEDIRADVMGHPALSGYTEGPVMGKKAVVLPAVTPDGKSITHEVPTVKFNPVIADRVVDKNVKSYANQLEQSIDNAVAVGANKMGQQNIIPSKEGLVVDQTQLNATRMKHDLYRSIFEQIGFGEEMASLMASAKLERNYLITDFLTNKQTVAFIKAARGERKTMFQQEMLRRQTAIVDDLVKQTERKNAADSKATQQMPVTPEMLRLQIQGVENNTANLLKSLQQIVDVTAKSAFRPPKMFDASGKEIDTSINTNRLNTTEILNVFRSLHPRFASVAGRIMPQLFTLQQTTMDLQRGMVHDLSVMHALSRSIMQSALPEKVYDGMWIGTKARAEQAFGHLVHYLAGDSYMQKYIEAKLNAEGKNVEEGGGRDYYIKQAVEKFEGKLTAEEITKYAQKAAENINTKYFPDFISRGVIDPRRAISKYMPILMDFKYDPKLSARLEEQLYQHIISYKSKDTSFTPNPREAEQFVRSLNPFADFLHRRSAKYAAKESDPSYAYSRDQMTENIEALRSLNTDPIRGMDAYANMAMRAIYFDPYMPAIKQFLNVVNNHIKNQVVDEPTRMALTKDVNSLFSDFYGSIFGVIPEGARKFKDIKILNKDQLMQRSILQGLETILGKDFDSLTVGEASNMASRLVYMNFLGLPNYVTVMKQIITQAPAAILFGPRHFLNAMTMLAKDKSFLDSMLSMKFRETKPFVGILSSKMSKFENALMYAFQKADEYVSLSSAATAVLGVRNAIKIWEKSGKSMSEQQLAEQLFRTKDVDVARMNELLATTKGTSILKKITKSGAISEGRQFKGVAHEVANLIRLGKYAEAERVMAWFGSEYTNFRYGPGGNPKLFRDPRFKPFLMFKTYTTNYHDFFWGLMNPNNAMLTRAMGMFFGQIMVAGLLTWLPFKKLKNAWKWGGPIDPLTGDPFSSPLTNAIESSLKMLRGSGFMLQAGLLDPVANIDDQTLQWEERSAKQGAKELQRYLPAPLR